MRWAYTIAIVALAACTPDGGRIEIAAERAGSQVRIVVRDNGIGIVPGLLPHVFDIFVQGERGPDRREGGLGVGLTIVRAIGHCPRSSGTLSAS